jgi:hypothetical protein
MRPSATGSRSWSTQPGLAHARRPQPRWDLATAAQCAAALDALGVYWLEEPLPATIPTAYACCAAVTSIRLAAGELVRSSTRRATSSCAARSTCSRPTSSSSAASAAAGASRARRPARTGVVAARMVERPRPRREPPRSGGALHVPYVEVPYDPPAWSPERRDWLLGEPLEIASDGTIAPPPGPGLGVELDFERLEQYRVG